MSVILGNVYYIEMSVILRDIYNTEMSGISRDVYYTEIPEYYNIPSICKPPSRVEPTPVGSFWLICACILLTQVSYINSYRQQIT